MPFTSPMSSQQADIESAFPASPPGSVDGHPPTFPPLGGDGEPPAAFAETPSSVAVLDAKHVVADGDTLGLIGEMYQTPVRVIQRLNDLHPDSIIYPGETLRVPTQLRAETHVVTPGETLVAIAKRFDAPVDHVKALNGLSGGDAVIRPGETLRVLRGTNAAIARRERDLDQHDGGSLEDRAEMEARTTEGDDVTAAMPTASNPPPVRDERRRDDDGDDDERRSTAAFVSSRRSKSSAVAAVAAVASFPARLLNATVDATARVASEITRPLGWRPIRLPSGTHPGGETNPAYERRVSEKNTAVARRVSARPGESLASIAARHGLRVRELQRANGITSDALDVGQALRVKRLSAAERAPRLRRRTRRHLFQRDSFGVEGDEAQTATRAADGAWRRWRWRYEPRGGDAREFFSRRAGVGRSDALNGDFGRSDARNAAMLTAGDARDGPATRATAWEDRRPRRASSAWHPRLAAPISAKHDAFVTSGFGWRWGRLHAGVDLAANEGTPIRAAAGGTVRELSYDGGGYGWLLRVAHGDGWETRYAHCRAVDARLAVGRKVRRGQKVAEVGNTGRSFGPHLHFEVRRNGQPVDPLTCSDA